MTAFAWKAKRRHATGKALSSTEDIEALLKLGKKDWRYRHLVMFDSSDQFPYDEEEPRGTSLKDVPAA